jgi:hypothetical protein
MVGITGHLCPFCGVLLEVDVSRGDLHTELEGRSPMS